MVSLIERRADQLDYVLVDTPGQIEIFTWSASGAIITEAFASTFPTVIAYVVDTPRSGSPVTFMSNMLYACSILYKTRLPLVLTFNKVDVTKHEFALEVIKKDLPFGFFNACFSTFFVILNIDNFCMNDLTTFIVYLWAAIWVLNTILFRVKFLLSLVINLVAWIVRVNLIYHVLVGYK